jgi:hypothetical protein
MGFLTKFIRKSEAPKLNRLPSGSFTIDGEGRIISSTVAQSFSPALLKEISLQVLAVFKGARAAQVQFSELVVNYEAFKITARELRGGAMIFLSPKLIKTTTSL